MTLVRAPGKLVLSGAYAVLSGAPALVAAVDRFALADADRPAEWATPEVRAALASDRAPWFDASALRKDGKKLGLGSSAAILVASLAALEVPGQAELADRELCARIYQRALLAHRAAQGGGSGIDVAASAHGGLLVASRSGSELALSPVAFPPGLQFEVWASPVAASTAEFLSHIAELGRRDAALHRSRLGDQAEAAEAARSALELADANRFVAAIARQVHTLHALGQAAGIRIVTPEGEALAVLAAAHGGAFLPAGAGGGDVSFYVGRSSPPPEFAARAAELGLFRVELELGARGVHCASAGELC